MKANIKLSIEINGEVEDEQFLEWLKFQFGILKKLSDNNPLKFVELRDADFDPYYKFEIIK